MIGRWTPAQERGLLVLIAVSLLAGGLSIALPRAQHRTSAPLTQASSIVLPKVRVVLPVFVDPQPVDVNTAGEEDLIRLSGIGPALAGRIIAYRTAHGPFASLDDLVLVQGIGPQTLEGLRDEATASPPS